MKTLNNHTVIYDSECPMCDLYTGAFVKTKMLDRGGRLPYSDTEQGQFQTIDFDRARNEIALVNKENGEVVYGVESLTKIIGNRYPILQPLFRLRSFQWAIKKLYSFISYNRKVIIPSVANRSANACVPDFNLRYRIAFVTFTWIVTSFILNAYTHRLFPLIPRSSFYREFMICGGQIIFQGIVVSSINRNKLLEYLGNMMTISFAGALLLLPAIVLSKAVTLPVLFFAIWFMMVVGLMFLEHLRRVKILEINWVVSISWVAYRLLVLSYIFYANK